MSRFSVDSITPLTVGQAVASDKFAAFGELMFRPSLNALRKLQDLSMTRPRISRSASGMVMRGRLFSPRGLDHKEPYEDLNEWMLLERQGGRLDRIKVRQIPPPPHLLPLEEKCWRLLDESISSQEASKRVLHPRARCVYGDLGTSWVVPDTRDEVHADYSLAYINEETAASHRAVRKKWNANKSRGVEYPRVLQVRRKELTLALQNLAPHLQEYREVEVEQKRCGRCARDLKVVPHGNDRSDWLSILYQLRAWRCERQRSNPSEAERARAIIINRALEGNESYLATWTSRRDTHFIPQPSLLSGRPRQPAGEVAAELLNLDSLFIDTGEGVNEELDSEAPYEEFEDSSSSASVYSQETNPTSENMQLRPGVYRPVEMPGLLWVKRFRVPQFDHETGYSRWTLAPVDEVVARMIPEDEAEEEAPSSAECDVNKPLPPLPPPN